MNEGKKNNSEWRPILGGIVLIVVLFIGIKLVFWGLGQVIRQDDPGGAQSASVSQDVSAGAASGPAGAQAPRYCVHCGQGLPESFQWGQFCPFCGKKVE